MQLQFFLVPSHFIQLHYPLYLSCLSYIISPPNQSHTTYTHFFFRIDKQIDYQFSFFLKSAKEKRVKKGEQNTDTAKPNISHSYIHREDTTQDRRGWVNQYVNMEKQGEIGKQGIVWYGSLWAPVLNPSTSACLTLMMREERREKRNRRG